MKNPFRWASKPFKMLVGVSRPGDPSGNGPNPNPVPIRQTHTMGVGQMGRKRFQAGMEAGGKTAGTSTITVSSNDFNTGRALLILGDYRFESTVDFAVGGSANATAGNIANLINTLPGYTAGAVGPVVTVSWSGLGEVEFRAEHHGSIQNFTLAPTNDLLTQATPSPGAPTVG